MTLDLEDTIAAIASAPGGAARGIIRLSGCGVKECLDRVFASARFEEPLPAAGRPVCLAGKLLLLPPLGEVPARLYYWPTRRSYTRQPAAELHLPGSPPILEAGLAAVCRAGARLARPGEFTLRAFLAGRLDLTQAEAVLGVIEARDQAELKAALSQLAGGLAAPLSKLRNDLLDTLAHLEAGLDFADEDIDFLSRDQLQSQLGAAISELAAVQEQFASRRQADDLPNVVLVGEPNAGKSSLLNALVGTGAALVSPRAGTTRDAVTVRARLDGIECLLVDTAGIENAPAATISAAAQSQRKLAHEQAQLVILCLDACAERTAWELAQLQQPGHARRLVVATKADLADSRPASLEDCLATSSRTGQGIDPLRSEIARRLRSNSAAVSIVLSTAARCGESLMRAAQCLARAEAAAAAQAGDELIAAEIRGALDELGQVVGAVYTDDILDRVFSRFCIGK